MKMTKMIVGIRVQWVVGLFFFLRLAWPVYADVGSSTNTADKRGQVKQLYEAGERAYRLGDAASAIRNFKDAYALTGDALMLYNIGQGYRQLGDTKQALFFYQQSISAGAVGDWKGVAEKRIAELKIVLDQEERARQAPPTGVAQSPTTQLVSSSPAVVARPARKPWYRNPAGWTLTAGGIVIAAVGGALLAVAAGQGTLADGATSQAAFDQHHASDLTFQKAGWPLLGIGAASAITGVFVLSLSNRSAH